MGTIKLKCQRCIIKCGVEFIKRDVRPWVFNGVGNYYVAGSRCDAGGPRDPSLVFLRERNLIRFVVYYHTVYVKRQCFFLVM